MVPVFPALGAGSGPALAAILACSQHPQKRGHERRAGSPQFLPVVEGEVAEDLLPFGGEVQQNLPAVFAIALAAHVAALGQAIGQLDRAVMPQLQPFRQYTNPRAPMLGKSFDGQQELMLAGFHVCLACHLLTEAQEFADLVAQFGERFIIRPGQGVHGRIISEHDYISHHDVLLQK